MNGQYRTKYFLTSKATCSLDVASSSAPQREETCTHNESARSESEVYRIDEGEAQSQNSSREVLPLSNANQVHKKHEAWSTIKWTSAEGRKENQNSDNSASNFQPIVPWINGDGTINGIVHRGLTRRIFGIVIQNPGILEVLFPYPLLFSLR